MSDMPDVLRFQHFWLSVALGKPLPSHDSLLLPSRTRVSRAAAPRAAVRGRDDNWVRYRCLRKKRRLAVWCAQPSPPAPPNFNVGHECKGGVPACEKKTLPVKRCRQILATLRSGGKGGQSRFDFRIDESVFVSQTPESNAACCQSRTDVVLGAV